MLLSGISRGLDIDELMNDTEVFSIEFKGLISLINALS